jgi:hypothetical protein
VDGNQFFLPYMENRWELDSTIGDALKQLLMN